MIFFTHAIGSILVSLPLSFMLKSIKHENRINYFLFSLAIQLFIPFFGLFIFILVYRPRKSNLINQFEEKEYPLFLSTRNITNTFPKKINIRSDYILPKYSISSIISTNSIAPEERQKAVLDTLKLQDKDAVPLLKKALKDSDDDVRLLAYALLKRKENIIVSRLHDRLQEINNSQEVPALSLHKAIAYDCWEMIYLELVQGEVKKYHYELAIKHIKVLLQHHKNDPGINLLYAKILLKQRDFNQARIYLINARNSGIDKNKILPYFAELAFYEKRLDNMSTFIKDINEDVCSYKISRMIEVVNDV
jgi:hypothetical protein